MGKTRLPTQSELRLAEAENSKSVGKWIMYFFVGYLPFLIGLFWFLDSRFNITGNNHESYVVLEGMAKKDYITGAIPFFFVAIFFECVIAFVKGEKVYRLTTG